MRSFLLICTAFCFILACKNKPSELIQTKTANQLPQDFSAFYEKFHSDSAFQMEHIEWPLKGEKGIKADSTQAQTLTEWSPEQWKIMVKPDTAMSTLKCTYETVGDVLVIEKMFYPMVGVGYERQFFKDDDGAWKLIYYAESTSMR